jgi:hypothetical protein
LESGTQFPVPVSRRGEDRAGAKAVGGWQVQLHRQGKRGFARVGPGKYGLGIRAAQANLAAITGATIVIPGHGPVSSRSDVVEFHDMLVTIREKVAALKKQGRSMDETVAAKPTASFDAKWGQFLITPDMFTTLVYAGV